MQFQWAIAFTLVLLTISAVPVLAESAPQEPSPERILAGLELGDKSPPNASDIVEGLRRLEEKEAAREQWLENPQAEQERQESLHAFADATPSEAAALLDSLFAEQLVLIDQDPARAISDAKLEQVLSETDAQVTVDGKTMLMEGTLPVKALDEEGEEHKVDLDLVAEGEDYAPANPIVELGLPDSASEPIAVGEEGLAITPVLTEPPSEGRLLEGENILYHETQGATDTIAAPIGSGLELFSLLRSVESPEELRFELTLPVGAELRSDSRGGLEVLRGEELLASVPAPTAIDAQGTEIPVTMHAEGSELVLEVPHRSMDLSYPALVDPAILENWYDNGNDWYHYGNLWSLSHWYASSNDWGRFQLKTEPINAAPGLSNRGLFVAASKYGAWQPSERIGQWTYTAPGSDTYFYEVSINPLWRWDQGCGYKSYPEPHDYTGLWNATYGWATVPVHADWARIYGYGILFPEQELKYPDTWRAKTGNVVVIGLGTGASGGPAISCTRDLYAGGVQLWMDDWGAPTLGTVTGAPTGWINGTKQFTISASASDTGLGVQNFAISPEGAPVIYQSAKPCSGLRSDLCPANTTKAFNLTGQSFDEGKKLAKLYAYDPTGKVSGNYQWSMQVDRTQPDVTLDGQLALVTDEDGSKEPTPEETEVEELSLPVYNLKIEAKDGSNASDSQKRSGVKNIEVLLDGKPQSVEWKAQECPASSCEMNKTYPLKLLGLTVGQHTLEVLVSDQVDNVRKRSIEFEYIPATGMKDEYVMHYFPLPDGLGNEEEELRPSRPELAVNVMNGNLVYREKDIDVGGYAVDLEVERYYNSQLPEAENTEWGDGWTLAQTPELEPEATKGQEPPQEAELLNASGSFEEGVELPTEVGAEKFDPALQAMLTKDATGYELSDETGDSATSVAFDESGRATELRTESYAGVDLDYEEGALSAIEVEDPASATSPPDGEEAELDPTPVYVTFFGTSGSGNGQLNKPADVAVDAAGNVWVADRLNNRIQKFGAKGEYLSQFGSSGSGNGQLSAPAGLAIDAEGNIWVADSGNRRVQKFNAKGEYLTKFGSQGTGNGQFTSYGPRGIGIDAGGNIWVSDYSSRIQKFNAKGEFVKVVGSGQFGESTGLDIGGGKVWVGDWTGNRVNVFSEAGEYLFKVGSAGSGNGQFSHPDAVEVDAKGDVWVGDEGNSRVQQLNAKGEYVDQFGANGSGSGQFKFGWPFGLTSDGSGSLWIADSSNHRVQHWQAPEPEPAEDDDPRVDVEVEGGLVASVEGEEAGEHSYAHEGNLLTSHDGPEGETVYGYDEAKRLSSIELANGTQAQITYHADGRVKSVTVDPAGEEKAKTTYFTYSDEPRRTTVEPEKEPVITYDIGPDGSVLKWQNAVKPPEFEDLAGTLYANKETSEPISTGDHNLVVQAYSPEGIASIDVVANGEVLVDEKTCDQDPEQAGIECQKVPNEWVTNTGNHAPGVLDLEVQITDRLGQISAERFWVNIPYTPPPSPGAAEKPVFATVLKFREEHGLDIDLDPVEDEMELNDRVFNTIGDWEAGDPIARASMERWGAPLRTPDEAELDWRIQYWQQASEVIPNWVAANASATFAGFYLDERAGGKIFVGFTGAQASETFSALEQGAGLIAGADRIEPMTGAPKHTLASLQTLQPQISAAASGSYPAGLVNSTRIDVPTNKIRVGASNVPQAQSLLQASFGAGAPISVHLDRIGRERKDSRQRVVGKVRAGDELMMTYPKEEPEEELFYGPCTASFGAFERGKNKAGKSVLRMFALTAGHCAGLEKPTIYRRASKTKGAAEKAIGEVRRWGWKDKNDPGIDTDAAAIRLDNMDHAPRLINQDEHLPPIRVTSVWSPRGGMLCFSGRSSEEKRCGPALSSGAEVSSYNNIGFETSEMCFATTAWGGDSGSPVWVEGTGVAVGILTTSTQDPNEPGWKSEFKEELEEFYKEEEYEFTPEELAEAIVEEEERLREEPEACFNLLKAPSGGIGDGTAFQDSYLAPLHLVTATNARP